MGKRPHWLKNATKPQKDAWRAKIKQSHQAKTPEQIASWKAKLSASHSKRAISTDISDNQEKKDEPRN